MTTTAPGKRHSRQPDWSWATVVVVDGEGASRAMVAALAGRVGIGTVLQASDGDDCLALLQTTRPDLIVLDMLMDQAGGYATCARIRALANLAEVPVLALTALTAPGDMQACFDAGASDVVAKPVRPAELTARLRVHLENRRLVRTLSDANHRMRRELEGACDMQRLLFPSPVALESLKVMHGLSVEGRVQPLDSVGGDLWTVQVLDNKTVALLLADFSGHGLMAALNTFWLHAFIGQDTALMRDPAGFLGRLNDTLRLSLARGQFATAFVAVIDTERAELRWAGAGAPRPILVVEGQLHSLDTTGLPLGLGQSTRYSNHAIAFPPGAGLLAFSDGLTDLTDERGAHLEGHGLTNRLRPLLGRANLTQVGLEDLWTAALPGDGLPLGDDTSAVWVRHTGTAGSARPDPRHLIASGLGSLSLAEWSRRLGLPSSVLPTQDEHSRPVHMIARSQDNTVLGAFATPFAAIIEVVPERLRQDPPEHLVLASGQRQVLAALTTATAYRLPLASLFCEALCQARIIDEDAKGGVLLALQEAVANGVIHGNLEMHSPRRASENMRAYWAEIRSRLADPAKGQRLISVDARVRDGLLIIAVTDEGRGFNPDQIQQRDPTRPHGKGLRLIHQLTLSSEVALGGRQHVLTFSRRGTAPC